MEAERLEFEAVAEALSRSPRLANLLRYVGEKYFSDQSDQLTEYNIATEVFGRPKTVFDAGEDAIARVEAHRLRKRLKEFYEGAGKDHPIQLSIPPGTYAPVFAHKPAAAKLPTGALAASGNGAAALQASQAASPAQSAPNRVAPFGLPLAKHWPWFLSLLAIVLICTAVAGYVLLSRSRSAAVATAGPGVASALPGGLSTPAAVPVRLLAGYSGEPQTDSAGAAWDADRYVHGGGPWRRPESFVARTSDPMLFQQWRTGDSFYDIPLAPGVYELHLYFVTSERSSDVLSTFSVKVNGNVVLQGFDVNSDAMGENIADERIFRDVSPAADGLLHLSLTTERGAPEINAIEVLPGIPHKMLPVRLVMQRTPFTAHSGQFWHPDTYFMNGRISDLRQQISGSPDPDLFATERYGHFNYAIPVDTRDRYTLILHFAEFYFGPQAAGGGGVGSRVFRVMCNGETLLDNFDIFKEAGSLHALTKTFYHLKASAQGKLNLTFEPIANNATVSGIEVLDESK